MTARGDFVSNRPHRAGRSGVSAFAHLAAQAASGDPGDRLAALRLCVPGRIVFTTSFGLEDQAIAHLIFTRKLDVEVATLDTGRLFAATHRVWEATERRYGVRIPSWHPEPLALAAFVADAGIDGFYGSKQARLGCCNVRKVEPLNRALAGASAWVTGLRSDQSDGRGGVELAAWESDRSLVKFAPLFDWSRERVADFCAAQGVPVNELHALGFPSIGCEPCTRAVAPGEPERAGRWWWENDEARECGLHVGGDGKLGRRKAA